MRRVSKLMIAAVLIGSLLRFSNLEGKVYWHDETYTALYTTGYGREEASAALFDGQLKEVRDVLVWQTVVSEHGLGKTIRQLAEDDSQHPPLYYVLARGALYVTDNTIVATRAIAVIAGILLIPAMYWFGLQLFNSKVTANLSAALVAVSPFHYLYAQEAREYSLWALTTALSSGALLQALRKKNALAWLIYTGAITASLYACILTFLVIASHGLYVVGLAIATHRTKRTESIILLRNFALSTASSLLLFAPWLQLIKTINAASWTAQPIPLTSLVKIWVGNLTRLFLDLNLDTNDPLLYTVPSVLAVIVFIGYAVVWNLKRMPKPAAWFLLLLGGVTLLAFISPDLLLGGRRSSVSRYFIPTYLSLELAVAYLLSQKISSHQKVLNQKVSRKKASTNKYRPVVWKGFTAGLLAAGLVSCLTSIPSDTWWHKKNSHFNPAAARIINQSSNALIISSNNNANLGEIFSLSHQLASKQNLLLFREPDLPTVPTGFSSVFLFNPSAQVREQIDGKGIYELTDTYKKVRLWQIHKK